MTGETAQVSGASMAAPPRAVFLSYASEDAPAAERIAEALRAAGIDVWLDQSELRGGDAWDRQIRKQIHDCALFIPVVSAHSDARHEGYFRREWRLAVERAGDMADDIPFLLPVVIDSTPEAIALVPDRFREVQWSRLPDGQATPSFVQRVVRLLTPQPATTNRPATSAAAGPIRTPQTPITPVFWWSKPVFQATAGVIVLAALAYFVADRFWMSRHVTASPTVTATTLTTAAPTTAAAFSPPPHSIAVLPFVNMSGEKEQEYFSEGLTEELLNSLARINELQVAARTSSFSFQGEHPDIATVAHKLNVGAVLEGSVRRSANTVRVTTQLVNGVTGFHLWSETYDRDLGDVLKLETEIATAVASALKVTLLGDVGGKIELGGTRNPAAFDAYLRGSKTYVSRHQTKDVEAAIQLYTEATRLDPNYALAFAARSLAFADLGTNWSASAWREAFEKAQTDARRAIALAPDLAEGHLTLAAALAVSLDFRQASNEYERAVALTPGNAEVFRNYSDFESAMGRSEAGVAAARRAVLLDPLNPHSHAALSSALFLARRRDEAKAVFEDVLALDPEFYDQSSWMLFYDYTPNTYQDARASCEKRADHWAGQICLAMIYDKLGRHADAEAELAKFKASNPAADDWYEYASVYAQWGDTAKALSCLDKAVATRDVSLYYLKIDPLLDPLRKEPRFQAIERELKFPQ
jgi:TolB-like protein/predicted Zn-dependent protease